MMYVINSEREKWIRLIRKIPSWGGAKDRLKEITRLLVNRYTDIYNYD